MNWPSVKTYNSDVFSLSQSRCEDFEILNCIIVSHASRASGYPQTSIHGFNAALIHPPEHAFKCCRLCVQRMLRFRTASFVWHAAAQWGCRGCWFNEEVCAVAKADSSCAVDSLHGFADDSRQRRLCSCASVRASLPSASTVMIAMQRAGMPRDLTFGIFCCCEIKNLKASAKSFSESDYLSGGICSNLQSVIV